MSNLKVLITGSSGTGKSTIYKELVKRNLNAYDADDRILGLCSWVDRHTGKDLGRGFPDDFSVEKYDWRWKESVLRSLLSGANDVYVCGNANNAPEYYALFDRVFVLSLPDAEQRKRIRMRTEHDFGKDIATQDAIIKRQAELVAYAHSIKATLIDASSSPSLVADAILDNLS